MKITYYTIGDYRGYLSFKKDPSELCFASPDLCAKFIAKNYIFEPHLPNLTNLEIYGKVPRENISYKLNKDGTVKLDKKGQKMIQDTWIDEVNVLKASYVNYNINKYSFENGGGKSDGYHEFKYDIMPPEILTDKVIFRANPFVKFVTAKLIVTPEIKRVGEPYSPSTKRVVVEKESDWFPIFVCQDQFGINNNMDNWFKTKPYVCQGEIYINKEEIEILETLPN